MVKNVDKNGFVNINNCNIPLEIKNVKNSKSVKIYIKSGKIIISKSKYISTRRALEFFDKNKDKVYDMYLKEISNSIDNLMEGDLEILYKGKLTNLKCANIEDKKVKIEFLNDEIIIYIFKELSNQEKVENIKKILKKELKNRLDVILYERLEYYSKLMNIEYLGYSIKSMSTRYGSCNVKTKKLNFNINLIFTPQMVLDSVVVHELSHIKYKGHDKNFYSLVYRYIPNYKECDKWLKQNEKYLKLLY